MALWKSKFWLRFLPIVNCYYIKVTKFYDSRYCKIVKHDYESLRHANTSESHAEIVSRFRYPTRRLFCTCLSESTTINKYFCATEIVNHRITAKLRPFEPPELESTRYHTITLVVSPKLLIACYGCIQ